jgi:uncharacterized membrane protein YraQ (UPF0718 family)
MEMLLIYLVSALAIILFIGAFVNQGMKEKKRSHKYEFKFKDGKWHLLKKDTESSKNKKKLKYHIS